MLVYRIAKAGRASSGKEMMAGDGGLHASARWHTVGKRIAYTATSQALATLEIAVNLNNPKSIPSYRILEVEVPDDLILTLEIADLPVGWDRKDDEPLAARRVGDIWLSSGLSVALQIPSSIIPGENNILINPAHTDFSQITYDAPLEFPFDPRIKA